MYLINNLKDSEFKLSFAPHQIPRFLAIPMKKTDSSDYQEKETIEEISYRLFPKLGSQSRPDRLNLKGSLFFLFFFYNLTF